MGSAWSLFGGAACAGNRRYVRSIAHSVSLAKRVGRAPRRWYRPRVLSPTLGWFRVGLGLLATVARLVHGGAYGRGDEDLQACLAYER